MVVLANQITMVTASTRLLFIVLVLISLIKHFFFFNVKMDIKTENARGEIRL